MTDIIKSILAALLLDVYKNSRVFFDYIKKAAENTEIFFARELKLEFNSTGFIDYLSKELSNEEVKNLHDLSIDPDYDKLSILIAMWGGIYTDDSENELILYKEVLERFIYELDFQLLKTDKYGRLLIYQFLKTASFQSKELQKQLLEKTEKSFEGILLTHDKIEQLSSKIDDLTSNLQNVDDKLIITIKEKINNNDIEFAEKTINENKKKMEHLDYITLKSMLLLKKFHFHDAFKILETSFKLDFTNHILNLDRHILFYRVMVILGKDVHDFVQNELEELLNTDLLPNEKTKTLITLGNYYSEFNIEEKANGVRKLLLDIKLPNEKDDLYFEREIFLKRRTSGQKNYDELLKTWESVEEKLRNSNSFLVSLITSLMVKQEYELSKKLLDSVDTNKFIDIDSYLHYLLMLGNYHYSKNEVLLSYGFFYYLLEISIKYHYESMTFASKIFLVLCLKKLGKYDELLKLVGELKSLIDGYPNLDRVYILKIYNLVFSNCKTSKEFLFYENKFSNYSANLPIKKSNGYFSCVSEILSQAINFRLLDIFEKWQSNIDLKDITNISLKLPYYSALALYNLFIRKELESAKIQEEIFSLANDIKDYEALASLCQRLAIMNKEQHNHRTAIKYAQLAYEYSIELQDFYSQAVNLNTYIDIAHSYRLLNDIQLEKLCIKAIEMAKKYGSKITNVVARTNMVKVCINLRKFEIAKLLCEENLRYSIQYEEPLEESIAYNLLGTIHSKISEYNIAENYFLKDIQLSDSLNNPASQIESRFVLSQFYLSINKIEQSLTMALEAMELANDKNMDHWKNDITTLISEITSK